MITFLKPIIEQNKITYPVNFNNHISKKKYNIITEYLTTDKLDLVDCIEGIMSTYAPLAICNNLTMVSEVPVDKKFRDNLMEMVEVFKKFQHHDVMYSCKPGSKLTKNNSMGNNQVSSNPAKLELIKRDVNTFGLKINAEFIDKPINQNNRCASTMSGGVDSIYTTIKHNSEITDLFYVIGYDIAVKPTNQKWIDEVVEYNRQLANKFGKNFILCRSNLLKEVKEFVKDNHPGSEWANYLVSGGIAHIIYALGFKKLFISGDGYGYDFSKEYDETRASKTGICGAMFDNKLSSNLLDVVHVDGVLRWQKIHEISKYDKSLLPTLRFCVKYDANGGLNCGHCSKCIMTYCMCYLLGLAPHMEIQKINNETYKTIVKKYLIELTGSPYKKQIEHLLANFNHNKKTTTIT